MNEQFSFGQVNNEELYGEVQHLQSALEGLGLESPLTFGLSADMEVDQLTAAIELIQNELEEAERLADIEERKRLRGACHIGPYANRICTICGGNQP